MNRRTFLTASAVGMASIAGCLGPGKLDVETQYEVSEGIDVALEEAYDSGLNPLDGSSVTITIASEQRGEYWVRISALDSDGVVLGEEIETMTLYVDEAVQVRENIPVMGDKIHTIKVQVEPYTNQPTEDSTTL